MTNRKSISTFEIAVIAVMSALTMVATMMSINFAPTGGYFNFGDVIVVTTALLFGSIIGGVTGGLGSALADIILGYGLFAPFTFIIKGTEGFVVGYLAGGKENTSLSRKILAWLIGGIIIIAGYWIAEVFFLGIGAPAATTEALTINSLQAIISILGIPISIQVRKRLPIIRD